MCVCFTDYVNPNCPDCIKFKFMGNLATRDYTINWTTCTSDDPLFSQLCNLNGQNFVSSVHFCYGVLPAVSVPNPKCRLYMTIDNAPACVRNCVTGSFPYCVKLKAKCVGNAANDIDLTLDSNDVETELVTKITWTITRDPIITICCTKKVNSTYTYKYCCTGQTNQ
jgi:hypothetical protein